MIATKEKAQRTRRAIPETSRSYHVSGRAPRYSRFNLGDDGKALRALEADGWLENYMSSHEAALEAIHAYFLKIEEDFIAEQAAYAFPDTFDQTLLQIHRNSMAARLIVKAKPQFHKFIWARAAMPVELPAVQKSEAGGCYVA